MESGRAERLSTHRRLDRTSIKGPDKARELGIRRHRSCKHSKAADWEPDEEYTRPKPFRVRKTVQNRCIDISATDPDRQNRHRAGHNR